MKLLLFSNDRIAAATVATLLQRVEGLLVARPATSTRAARLDANARYGQDVEAKCRNDCGRNASDFAFLQETQRDRCHQKQSEEEQAG